MGIKGKSAAAAKAVPNAAASSSLPSSPIPVLQQQAAGGEQQAICQLLRHLAPATNAPHGGGQRPRPRQQHQPPELRLQAAQAVLSLLRERPVRRQVRDSLVAAGAARVLSSAMLTAVQCPAGPAAGGDALLTACCTALWQLCLSSNSSSSSSSSPGSGPQQDPEAERAAAALVQQGCLEAAVKLLLSPSPLPAPALVGAAGVVAALGCGPGEGAAALLKSAASAALSSHGSGAGAAPAQKLGMLGQHVSRLHGQLPLTSMPAADLAALTQGVGSLLVELLRPIRPRHVKLDALKSLHTILNIDCAHYGPFVLAAGAGSSLLGLLQPSRDSSLPRTALCTLAVLAEPEAHHAALAAAGAFPALLGLIPSSDPELDFAAVAALGNLCSVQARAAVLAAGAVPALVRVLLTGVENAKLAAAMALYNMQDDEELAACFAAAEGFTAAMGTVASLLVAGRGGAEMEVPLLRLIRSACRRQNSKEEAAKEEQRQRCSSPGGGGAAAEEDEPEGSLDGPAAAGRAELAAALLAAGAIPALLSRCRNTASIGVARSHFVSYAPAPEAGEPFFDHAGHVTDNAVWALSNLLAAAGCSAQPHRAEVIAALVPLLEDPGLWAGTLEGAAAAMFHLIRGASADPGAALLELTAAGGVPALTALLAHSDAGVQLAAVRAMRSLTQALEALRDQRSKGPRKSGSMHGLLSSNTAAALVALLQHGDREVRYLAVKSIASLAALTQRAGPVFQAAGALPALCGLQLAAAEQQQGAVQAALVATLHIQRCLKQSRLPGASGTAACALGFVTVKHECEGCGLRPATAAADDDEDGEQQGPRPEGSRLTFCGACCAVRYCSRRCQKAHWPQHKARCRKLEAVKRANDAAGTVTVQELGSRVTGQVLGELVTYYKGLYVRGADAPPPVLARPPILVLRMGATPEEVVEAAEQFGLEAALNAM